MGPFYCRFDSDDLLVKPRQVRPQSRVSRDAQLRPVLTTCHEWDPEGTHSVQCCTNRQPHGKAQEKRRARVCACTEPLPSRVPEPPPARRKGAEKWGPRTSLMGFFEGGRGSKPPNSPNGNIQYIFNSSQCMNSSEETIEFTHFSHTLT